MTSIAEPLHRWSQKLAHFIRGGKPAPEKRWSKAFVFNLVGGVGLAFVLLFQWLNAGYSLAINGQDVRCIPGTVFWVARTGITIETIERGRIYAYRSIGMKPLLPDGMLIGKIAAGLPGDRIDVDADGIRINGVKWGDLNDHVLKSAGMTVEGITRSFVVGADEVLMLGSLPRSYDGRYIGPINIKRFEGPAWRLW